MPKIDKLSWAKIKVDGKDYHQVLLVGDKVIPRDVNKLNKLFGTTHGIGNWEKEELLSNKPEIIIIGNGWSGVLKVEEEFKEKCKKAGIDLRILLTQSAVAEYNRLIEKKKKVNALIHTTC